MDGELGKKIPRIFGVTRGGRALPPVGTPGWGSRRAGAGAVSGSDDHTEDAERVGGDAYHSAGDAADRRLPGEPLW